MPPSNLSPVIHSNGPHYYCTVQCSGCYTTVRAVSLQYCILDSIVNSSVRCTRFRFVEAASFNSVMGPIATPVVVLNILPLYVTLGVVILAHTRTSGLIVTVVTFNSVINYITNTTIYYLLPVLRSAFRSCA